MTICGTFSKQVFTEHLLIPGTILDSEDTTMQQCLFGSALFFFFFEEVCCYPSVSTSNDRCVLDFRVGSALVSLRAIPPKWTASWLLRPLGRVPPFILVLVITLFAAIMLRWVDPEKLKVIILKCFDCIYSIEWRHRQMLQSAHLLACQPISVHLYNLGRNEA